MAIVMMTTDIDMPGRPRRAWYSKDTATLKEVSVATYQVLTQCVQVRRLAGWMAVGMSSRLSFAIFCFSKLVILREKQN